jgi:tetratricopeptide (TPR) repeat protein
MNTMMLYNNERTVPPSFLKKLAAVFILSLLVQLVFAAAAQAQRGASIPAETHYKTLRLLQDGHFEAAARLCRDELAGGTKIGQQRWIDSICYYTVLGETEYITGNPAGALDHFTSAIDIYLSVPDWITRVEYPTGTRHAARTVPPWGAGARNVALGIFPNDAMIRIGDPITDERIKQGGMLKSPELRRIDPVEIIRCTALAMRRRNEILGPLAATDHRSRPIVECFSKRPVSRNHWSSPMLDVMFGIALAGAGKHEEAIDRLGKSLLMEGEYDHFLSSDALIALGDIYLKGGKAFEATDSFFEASVSAFAYGNALEVEESLRKLIAADLVRNDPTLEFLLPAAQGWASDQIRSGWITASFNLLAAEKLVRRGGIDEAETILRGTIPLLNSAHLGESRYGDLYRYLAAVVQYRYGKIDEGNELLAQACVGASIRSPRFFQIAELNARLRDLTPRRAADLYDELLRISDFYDWAIDPVASYAADTSLWAEELGNQFLLAIERGQQEKAFDIAERIRVRRFLTPLDMGGRAFSLRYLIAAPEGYLSEEERVIRRNLFTDYPELEVLQKSAERIAGQLKPFSLKPNEVNLPACEELFAQLDEVSMKEEQMLRGIAAMPFAVPEIFPPRLDAEKTRAKIPEKAAILSFLEVDGTLYGFFLTHVEFDAWRVGSVSGIGRELAAFLLACGATDGNRAKLLKEFLSEEWRDRGNSFFLTLLGHPTGDDPRGSAQFEKLAIVPDSILWYTPFDAMTLPRGETLVPLQSVPNFTLFCAPTVSLCFARDEKGSPIRSETVLVPGKLHSKELESVQRDALVRFEKSLPKSAIWSDTPLRVSDRLLASQIDRLAVLGEIPSDDAFRIKVNPGKKERGTSVLDWRFLPWGGPRTIVLPGQRSCAEAALAENANGSEYFLPLLVLESQGAETLLVSRWRVGGPSTYTLVETFLNKSEKAPAADAWKETLAEFTAAELHLKEEPRFRGTPPKQPIAGEHPFFWGGYMLVDRGLIPFRDKDEDPEIEPKKDGADVVIPPAEETPKDSEIPTDGETQDALWNFDEDETEEIGVEPRDADFPDEEEPEEEGADGENRNR